MDFLMARFLARRAVTTLITLLGIIVVVFFVVRVLPGDPAALRAGPYADPGRLAQIRAQYGLDRSLGEQFLSYLGNLFSGNLGTSTMSNGSVTTELFDRLPASLELGVYAVVLACLIAIPLGVLAAARQGGILDRVVRVLAVTGSSMALFWLGLLLIYFFFYRLQWFPGPVDRLEIGVQPPPHLTGFYTLDALLTGQPGLAWAAARSLMLPIITLTIVLIAPILKMVRFSMIETLRTDYMRTAKAMGMPRWEVLRRDGLRNALLPVVTTIGIVFGYMLGGNIIVESLFSWLGVGRYAYQAIQNNDMDALQGFVLLVGVMYVLLNVVIDLVYAWIDPRIRLAGRTGA
jgi:ABC-type dipeptide/oligopeptide/nickel transport system permease component